VVLERDGEYQLGLSCEETSGVTYIQKERSTIHKITPRKCIWFCYILHSNCLLNHVIKDKIAGPEKRGRRHKQVLDDFMEREDTGSGT